MKELVSVTDFNLPKRKEIGWYVEGDRGSNKVAFAIN